jgi:outer membrane protein assembly factor BamE (lipoprotein component of BamABCDE complex)
MRSGTPRAKRWALGVLLLSAALPLTCCLGPPHFIRLIYGNYPLGRYPSGVIEKGMTADEVLSKLGPPHSRNRDGDFWYYMLDSYDIGWFGVHFGPDGKVTGTGGN